MDLLKKILKKANKNLKDEKHQISLKIIEMLVDHDRRIKKLEEKYER